MKHSYAPSVTFILFALAVVAPMRAQGVTGTPDTVAPVFRGVAWGMSRAEVAAIEGRDVSVPFDGVAFDLWATISYGFTGDVLARIDIDLTRPHDSATMTIAYATVEDTYLVRWAIDRDQAYNWRVSEYVRSEPCDGRLDARLLSGCVIWRNDGDNAAFGFAVQTVDGSTGRIVHTLTLTPPLPTAAPDERPTPSVMSLR